MKVSSPRKADPSFPPLTAPRLPGLLLACRPPAAYRLALRALRAPHHPFIIHEIRVRRLPALCTDMSMRILAIAARGLWSAGRVRSQQERTHQGRSARSTVHRPPSSLARSLAVLLACDSNTQHSMPKRVKQARAASAPVLCMSLHSLATA